MGRDQRLLGGCTFSAVVRGLLASTSKHAEGGGGGGSWGDDNKSWTKRTRHTSNNTTTFGAWKRRQRHRQSFSCWINNQRGKHKKTTTNPECSELEHLSAWVWRGQLNSHKHKRIFFKLFAWTSLCLGLKRTIKFPQAQKNFLQTLCFNFLKRTIKFPQARENFLQNSFCFNCKLLTCAVVSCPWGEGGSQTHDTWAADKI